jgi:hypothetical protein
MLDLLTQGKPFASQTLGRRGPNGDEQGVVLPTSDAGARHSSLSSNQPPGYVLNNKISGVATLLFRVHRCLSVLHMYASAPLYSYSRSRTQELQLQQPARIQLQAPTECKKLYPDKIPIIPTNERKIKYLNKFRWLHSLLQMMIQYRKCPQPPRCTLRNTTLRLPALDHQWNSERMFPRN